MSAADDDDLPVLTQVLRIGNGRPPRFAAHHADRAASGIPPDARSAAVRAADGESSWPHPLVIGSDAEPDVDASIDGSHDPTSRVDAAAGFDLEHAVHGVDGAAPASADTVADPRRIDLRDDVFLRSAPTDVAFSGRIDQPPLVVRHDGVHAAGPDNAVAPNAASVAASRDVPLVFRDPPSTTSAEADATFAMQVRDRVLRELSGRLDTELDARIAQTLHAALESALARLQTDLRIELAEALRDVVGNAVDDAIARLPARSAYDDPA